MAADRPPQGAAFEPSTGRSPRQAEQPCPAWETRLDKGTARAARPWAGVSFAVATSLPTTWISRARAFAGLVSGSSTDGPCTMPAISAACGQDIPAGRTPNDPQLAAARP